MTCPNVAMVLNCLCIVIYDIVTPHAIGHLHLEKSPTNTTKAGLLLLSNYTKFKWAVKIVQLFQTPH